MKPLNSNILAIQPSATLAIASLAKQMAAQGRTVYNFSAGEPDFATPEFITDSCVDALRKGQTKYTPVAGIPALCNAIAAKLKRDNNLDYKPSQIVVSCGAKHSLSLAFQTLLNPGDEVLLPSPYWLSYPEMIRIAGGKTVFIQAPIEKGYKITPQQVAAAVTPRTVALILNSPCNPTGAMYTPDELRAIATVAIEKGLTIVSDEIYEKMVYDGNQHASPAAFGPEFYQQTITINGFSKAFSMTGWRLGYAAGPEPFIKAMSALQSHSASAPTTFAQIAAVTALDKGDASIKEMVAAFDARRRRIHELIDAIPGVACPRPTGAFYVLPDISDFGMDSVTFAKRLLEENQVAVVPGGAFGADGCVRFSYACSMEEIEQGVARFRDFCLKLQK